MANIKFSQFTVGNTESDIDFVVGYKGANNIQISPANLLSATLAGYLPLTGGTMTGDVKFNDNVRAEFGNAGDLEIYHNGTNNLIDSINGDISIRQLANDKDIRFRCDDGSGGETEYFRLDGGDVRTIVSKPFRFNDGIATEFGTGLDMQIYHSGGEGTFFNYTGNLRFIQGQDNGDITFSSDDGSGGTTAYFFLDGSRANGTYVYTEFPDNSVIGLGNDTDLQIYHDSSNSLIDNFLGDLIIQQRADDKDIVFKSDDGSGGSAEYFKLQGSNERLVVAAPNGMKFNDNIQAKFGNGSDYTQFHDGTNTYLSNGTGDFYIRNQADDKDIIFQADDGSGGNAEYFRLDGSSVQTIVSKNFRYVDNAKILIGTGEDLQIYHGGTNSVIDNITGDLIVTNFQDDGDIKFLSDDGSGGTTEYFRIDGSDGNVKISKQFAFLDNVIASFGNAADLQIKHDGSNSTIDNSSGHLFIRNSKVDRDIIFQADDGTGAATTTYFQVDGAEEQVRFFKPTEHGDGVLARFGDSGDLRIYHDGSNSYIDDVGTGWIKIRGNGGVLLESYSEGETMVKASRNGAVELYYDNAVRFETASAGAQLTGSFYLFSGNYIHFDNGVSNSYAIRKTGTTLEFKTGGTYNFQSGNATFAGNLKVQGVLEYTDNAAAIAAGLTTGDLYRTGDLLKIVH